MLSNNNAIVPARMSASHVTFVDNNTNVVYPTLGVYEYALHNTADAKQWSLSVQVTPRSGAQAIRTHLRSMHLSEPVNHHRLFPARFTDTCSKSRNVRDAGGVQSTSMLLTSQSPSHLSIVPLTTFPKHGRTTCIDNRPSSYPGA